MTRQLLPLYSILVSGFLRLSHKTYVDFCDRNSIYNDFVHYDRLTTWENVILRLKQLCDRHHTVENENSGKSDGLNNSHCPLLSSRTACEQNEQQTQQDSYSELRKELLKALPSARPFFECE